MKNLLKKGLYVIAGTATAALVHAQAVVPDMDAKVDDAVGTITKVLIAVGSTVVFFTLIAIYKWVKKR